MRGGEDAGGAGSARAWILVLAVLGCGGSGSSADPDTGSTSTGGSIGAGSEGTSSQTGSTSQVTGTGETSGTGDTGSPPEEVERAYDLDGDGTMDSDLWIDVCGDAFATCLRIESEVTDVTKIQLWPGTPACDGTLVGIPIRVIGDHDGSALHEVMAAGCTNEGPAAPPIVAVVDVDGATALGHAIAPETQINAWVDAAAGPGDRLHPFLAPTYGDGLSPESNWMRLCAWRPELPSDDACGPGFASVQLSPPEPVFREVGGTLQDLDLDGWQDVNLVFHRTIETVSVATLSTIVATTFDVAAADEPDSPAWFHAGRNYGTHAAFTAADGPARLLVVGGTPVGTFEDELCNLSRFVAVLDATAGSPESRNLAWSHYFGFSSTIFATLDPQFADDPWADVARLADVVDGCVHRFSDSRARMGGEDVVAFNVFSMQAPIDYCLDEQFALYQEPPWTEEKADAWYGCFGQNVLAPGTWRMQVLRESDGVLLTDRQETYVWGRSDRLLPDEEIAYLVESLPGVGAFDLSDRRPSALEVWARVDGSWSSRGMFPIAGRPRIVTETPRGSRGVGSFTYFAELSLHDRDDDGLDEVELADGTWVGWDPGVEAFVTK